MINNTVDTRLQEKLPHRFILLLVLGSLSAFGPLSMDMYLPALPAVTEDLHTTASFTQLSITTCLLGLAVGQLVFGPLSDFQGRRNLLLITLVLFTLSSILCAVSSNIWLFVGFRFAQGFTAAAGIVISRAATRDLYSGKELTKFVALLAMVMGVAPILAPIIGGIILKWANWQTIFYMLALIGAIMFFAVFFLLPETLSEEKRTKGNIFAIVASFGALFKDRIFIGIAFSQSFISMGMFAYIAASPFVLQNIYGVSPQQFSLIFAFNGLGIIIMAQLAGKLAETIDESKLLFYGVSQAVVGSILLLLVTFMTSSLWLMIVALFLVISSVGTVNTTSFSLAMNRQGERAGSASAFLGILPFGGGAIVSPLVGLAGEFNAIPMGIVIFCCTLLSFIIYTLFVKVKIAS